MFPMNLDGDLQLNRLGRWQFEVVNRYKKVPAFVLVRPRWRSEKPVPEDRMSMVELEPDGKKIIELVETGILYIHWVVDDDRFVQRFKGKHLPKDGTAFCQVTVDVENFEAMLRLMKAKAFQCE